MPGNKKRFTIIELLVVIGIIAILTSMLLPGLQKARGMVSQTTCSGNLKQIGAGVHLYADDYNGCGPCGLALTSLLFNYSDRGGIAAYIGVSRVYWQYPIGTRYKEAPPLSICPEGGRDGSKGLTYNDPGHWANGTPNFSYALNYFLTGEPNADAAWGGPYGQEFKRIKRPGTRVLATGCGIDSFGNTHVGGRDASNGLYIPYRHNSGTNICFSDCHVEWLRRTEVPKAANITDDPQMFWREY